MCVFGKLYYFFEIKYNSYIVFYTKYLEKYLILESKFSTFIQIFVAFLCEILFVYSVFCNRPCNCAHTQAIDWYRLKATRDVEQRVDV